MGIPVQHLSSSQLGALRDCIRLLQLRYVEKRPQKRQSLSLALGRIAHATAAADYTHRMEKGIYLPDEAILDLADTSWTTETFQVDFKHEEQSPDEGKETARSMCRAHHRDVAPSVRPVFVEHRMEAPIAGLPVTILGIADVIADYGATVKAKRNGETKTLVRAGRHIRDTKTSAKAPHGISSGKIVPDDRAVAQLATYRIIGAATGQPSDDCWLDYVWPTKGGQAHSQRIDVTERDVRLVLEDYAALVRVYEVGLFPRTGRGSWLCKPGKCEFFDECILGVSRAMDL